MARRLTELVPVGEETLDESLDATVAIAAFQLIGNREHGWTTDITGHADFLDPIDHVAEVARHPPQQIIVLTDPNDRRVSASVQTAYVEALRRVGVAVDHRFLSAAGELRHDLQLPGILAAFTWLAKR